jgi:hypothetical protein
LQELPKSCHALRTLESRNDAREGRPPTPCIRAKQNRIPSNFLLHPEPSHANVLSDMTPAKRFVFGMAILVLVAALARGEELYQAPAPGTETRWVSPENPTGEKGAAGKVNHGAKGAAFIVIKPGETAALADIHAAGIIRRIWLSGTIPRNEEQRRSIRVQAFWDGAGKPAIDCPVGDFFGAGLGLVIPFQSALISSPEARSFNMTIPMPFRKRARLQLVNESDTYALVWYDINYTQEKHLPKDALYFHASWRRERMTQSGKDFEILPRIHGRGRYVGAILGVVGNPVFRGTWFGEGEVKIYLDGDQERPTLQGTGTEDYIGSGWGQGEYFGQYHGSLISDDKNDLYAFYRFHLPDPVYFHRDCRVTIQQMGNTSTDHLRDLIAHGAEAQPVLVLDTHGEDVLHIKGQPPTIRLLLDETNLPPFADARHPAGGVNFYRRDDVSATVYFYLDRPENGLPPLATLAERLADMHDRVWTKAHIGR